MNINQFLKDRTKQLEPETIDLRAYLHTYPELSSEEYKTSKLLKEIVIEHELIVEEDPNRTGFTALLYTKKQSRTLGVCTDMDDLPIEENTHNLAGKRKYIS